MGDERCEGCRYWLGPAEHRATDEGVVVGNSGRCRRYPPTLVVRGESISYPLPVVRDDDWCGEWRGKGELTPPGKRPIADCWVSQADWLPPGVRNRIEERFGDQFTVGQLCDLTPDELQSLRSFGPASLKRVRAGLALYGLTLKGDYYP